MGIVTDHDDDTVAYVVAVDGGGSKTDALLARTDGTVLGRRIGPGSSQHAIGPDAATEVVDTLVTTLLEEHAVPADSVVRAHCYLSAVDMPHEVVLLSEHIGRRPWARSLVVDNDVFALLRAGTDAADAAAVVLGTGINAAAVRADGERARYLALGRISGDWGGGTGLAEAAVWAAARDADGRGPRTSLHDAVLKRAGLSSMDEVSIALHRGQLDFGQLADLARDVLASAAAGDEVAAALRERQAEEVAVMARAALSRLGLARSPVPVVLGGGILRAGDVGFDTEVRQALARELPAARPRVSSTSPVLGALLLALEADAEVSAKAAQTYRDAS